MEQLRLKLRFPLSGAKKVGVVTAGIIGFLLAWTGWTGPELLTQIASVPWLGFFADDWFRTVLVVVGLSLIVLLLRQWLQATPATMETVTLGRVGTDRTDVVSLPFPPAKRDLILEYRNTWVEIRDLATQYIDEGRLEKDMRSVLDRVEPMQETMLADFDKAAVRGLGSALSAPFKVEGYERKAFITRLNSMVDSLDALARVNEPSGTELTQNEAPPEPLKEQLQALWNEGETLGKKLPDVDILCTKAASYAMAYGSPEQLVGFWEDDVNQLLLNHASFYQRFNSDAPKLGAGFELVYTREQLRLQHRMKMLTMIIQRVKQ